MKEILSNGSMRSIAQAIEEMKAEQGESFSLENINLAEMERRSGVSRGKLRRLKRNGFQDLPRATKGRKHTVALLTHTNRSVYKTDKFLLDKTLAILRWLS